MEFAIENAQTLKKRAMRRPRQQPPADQLQAQQPGNSGSDGPGQAAGRAAAAAAAPPATLPAAEGQPQAATAASRKQKGKRKRAAHAAERQVCRITQVLLMVLTRHIPWQSLHARGCMLSSDCLRAPQAAHADGARRAPGQAGPSTSGPGGEGAAGAQPGRAPKRVRRQNPGASTQAGKPGSSAAEDAQRTPPRQRRDAGDEGPKIGGGERGVRRASVPSSQDRQRGGQSTKAAGSKAEQAAPAKGKASKRRKTEAERGDKLDGLVAMYKQQLFGDATGKREAAKSSMQRWFD